MKNQKARSVQFERLKILSLLCVPLKNERNETFYERKNKVKYICQYKFNVIKQKFVLFNEGENNTKNNVKVFTKEKRKVIINA